MGLSSDPEKRQRQLDALAAHRGLSQDPERRERQLAALAEGRAKRHRGTDNEQQQEVTPTPVPASARSRRRVVRASYPEGERPVGRAEEAARETPEPEPQAERTGDAGGSAWLDRLDRLVS